MQSNAPPKKVKLNLLQAFRGIAALLVVLFHLDQLSNEKLKQTFLFGIFKFGWAGVDFFFILSGFIIFYVHRHELGIQSWQKFKKFWLKRWIRIYPVYWIVTLAVLGLLIFVPSLAKAGDTNLFFLLKTFLLIPQSTPPLLDVGWTLILIIFFYLIFSLSYLLKPKIYLPLVAILLLGSLTQFVPDISIPAENPWIGTIFHSMNLEFALGCLAAYLVVTYPLRHRKTLLFVGAFFFIFFGLLLSYGVIAEVQNLNILGIELGINRVFFSGIPCFIMLIGAASLDINKGTDVPNFVNYLGDASYSIYLIHSPIISALTQIAAKLNLVNLIGNSLIINLPIGIVSVGIGCVFYSIVEKPVVEFLRQIIVKKKVPPKAI
ncbi:acyltransferase family protein [Oscillatoria salina]|uniref:acyltransferase family protein n=1 Tax=Oscillatoria salina TaxID=331517 RepID=UPI001CCAC2E0|nr:acyltransferase [Oscillatoria salina]MBZ8180246.1 acyltransferase [Oscillatoria salina IIICB1]